MSRQIRDRADARQVINSLFGMRPDWIAAAVEELGDSALTDEAIIWIAQGQLDQEWAKAEPSHGEG